jgi:hypothetical protein
VARIDLLDRTAFLAGEEKPVDPTADPRRAPLYAERKERMAERLLDIAACNLMDGVTDAARGVVPLAVDRRATRRLADA